MISHRRFDITDFMILMGVLAVFSFVLPIMVCIFLQPSFNNILNKIINIESKFDNIESKMNDFYDATFGDFPYAVSLSTQCSINFITYENLDGNAFGVYSIIGNKEYIISNRNVVYDAKHNITRIISQITTFDGTNLTAEPPFLIFSKSDAPDLCLIPIKSNHSANIKSANITHKKCSHTTPFYSAIFRGKNIFHSKCNIVEDTPENSDLETDCSGMLGYSGSGYFNYKGELCAIHRSQRKYNFADDEFHIFDDLSIEEQAANYYYEKINKAYAGLSLKEGYISPSLNEKFTIFNVIYNAIKNADFSENSLDDTKLYFDQIFNNLNDDNNSIIYKEFVSISKTAINEILEAILIFSRNPRTLVDGSLIYDLLNQPSLVKEIYQNTTYILT